MKNFAKKLSLLLVFVMLVGLFAGCKPTNNSSTPETTTPTKGSGNTGEVVKIKWLQIGGQPGNLAENVKLMNEYTKEKIGVEVEIAFYDWGAWDKAVNNILNTGEKFDIMFTNGNHFTGHASQGKFLALDDLLKDTPALKEFIPEEVWKGASVKDKIYAVPTYKDSAATQYMAWDKRMVEKYEVPINDIKSLKDAEPHLLRIKAGEEAETGETVYPFPLAKEGSDIYKMYYDNGVFWDDASATVKNMYTEDFVIEELSLFHSWYEKGLINPDASTLEEAPRERILFVSQGFEGVGAVWAADRGYPVEAVPYTETIYSNNTILGSVNAISADSAHKEKSLEYLELVNTDKKLRNMLGYGVEGKDWELLEDGSIKRLTDTWTAPTYSQASFFNLYAVSPNAADQWEKVKAYQEKNAKNHVLLGFTFDTTSVADEFANVEAIFVGKKAELTTGVYEGKAADYFKAFNDEQNAAGLEKLNEERQKQIDKFLKK